MAYTFKKKIIIDSSKVGGATHSNFPLVVAGVYDGTGGIPDLRTTSNGGDVQHSSGYDIAFFSDEALTTQLDHETVLYNASTGQVLYYVKVPSVSHTADTEIYLGYGDSGISTDQSAKNAVWSGYSGVWHLGESVAHNVEGFIDSVASGHDATNAGTGGTSQVDGVLGKAQTFDGNDTLSFVGDGKFINTQEGRVSAWVKPGATATMTIFGLGSGGTNNTFRIQIQNQSGTLYAGIDTRGFDGIVYGNTTALSTSTNYKITVGSNGSAFFIWVNGVAQTIVGADNGAWIGDVTTSGTVQTRIGSGYRFGASESFVTGEISHVLFGDTLKTTAWELAEYNNQSSPSTFYSVEDVEESGEPGLPDGTYYWRVRAKDPDGSDEWGEWSSVREFTVE